MHNGKQVPGPFTRRSFGLNLHINSKDTIIAHMVMKKAVKYDCPTSRLRGIDSKCEEEGTIPEDFARFSDVESVLEII